MDALNRHLKSETGKECASVVERGTGSGGGVLGELDSGVDMSGVMMSSVTGDGGGTVVGWLLSWEMNRNSLVYRREDRWWWGGGGGADIWSGPRVTLCSPSLRLISLLLMLMLPAALHLDLIRPSCFHILFFFHPLHRRQSHLIRLREEKKGYIFLYLSFFLLLFFGNVFLLLFTKSGRLSLLVCLRCLLVYAFMLYDTVLPPYALPAT